MLGLFFFPRHFCRCKRVRWAAFRDDVEALYQRFASSRTSMRFSLRGDRCARSLVGDLKKGISELIACTARVMQVRAVPMACRFTNGFSRAFFRPCLIGFRLDSIDYLVRRTTHGASLFYGRRGKVPSGHATPKLLNFDQ
ncbi:hypothetical protein FVF58_34260 [Paraburkholderia panacisoli]|uniref:Uncharacterized protein n=1 Tax=Paraburkholderia panacisoli TaxID=2603818 RepID=A0A5B0GKH2_9BURK|nr:hypothetical protein [Paraburkholderia panacisoli]KAA1003973.1 hypothetical protein FVF58_34260 [Paraburkholderia panacisoli]